MRRHKNKNKIIEYISGNIANLTYYIRCIKYNATVKIEKVTICKQYVIKINLSSITLFDL